MHPWPARGPANQGELSAGGNTPSMPIFLGISWTLDKFPRNLQHFDHVMPVFPGNFWFFQGCDKRSHFMVHKFPGNPWHFERFCEILPWMIPKFPTNSWEFHGHLTNFLGFYSILIVLCQFSLGIFGIFKDLTRDHTSWCTNFLGIPGILKDFVKFCLAMMPKFATNSWEFHGHFLGIYSILIVLCQFSLGILGIFKDVTRDHTP